MLCEVLDLVRPSDYGESHAGSAWYEITPSAQRSYGALRFLDRAGASPPLASSRFRRSLLELVREQPGWYPGSAVLAMMILGSRAYYGLCAVDHESAA